MEIENAVAALASLAQETRLGVFRLLVKQGPAGLAAGAIAERLGTPPATLSFHLTQLRHAGLVSFRRESRRLIYVADFDGMRALLGFLTRDCCQGRPEICGSLVASLACPPPDRPCP
ncbi:MAG: helix-turn-helix transcriptional regulator [Proteobacteria bacterium]|nr:helix-turn-helix transcriptional regulator [Pseudomonadota bacterium]MBI3499201.1 helix-turn-helix transcriptional regulator [Pseudomonadota bacterium]